MNWCKNQLYIQIYKSMRSFTFKKVAMRFLHVLVHLKDCKDEVDGTL